MSKIRDKHIEDLELRSEVIQDILTKVPNWMIRWGSSVILFLIIILFFLAWLIKYPDIIISSAVITTEIPPQKEYAKISGKLDTLFVTDKQIVEKNYPLAIIENSADFNDVFILKRIIDTLNFNKNSLYFPIDNLPVLFLGDVESSYSEFESSYLNYILNKNLKPLLNEVNSKKKSISELRSQLQNLISQEELSKEQLKLKEKDIRRNKALLDRGVISEQEYEIKQLDFLEMQRASKRLSSNISEMREILNVSRKNYKNSNINRHKEEVFLLKKVMQSYNNLKTNLKEWELKYLLKSKIKGKVSFLNVWNSNQNVNKGDLIFTIIPTKSSEYIAKLKTPVKNSGKIKKGQKVNIKLENYPDNEYGILKGNVSQISSLPDKDGFYSVDVVLNQNLITSYNKKIDFRHEMIGEAEIVTEDLRLLERFFYQLTRLIDK